METLNAFLEQWEGFWLFLVLVTMLIVEIWTFIYTKREWYSSDSLDKKLDKMFSKHFRHLEETNRAIIRKFIAKKTRRKK